MDHFDASLFTPYSSYMQAAEHYPYSTNSQQDTQPALKDIAQSRIPTNIHFPYYFRLAISENT